MTVSMYLTGLVTHQGLRTDSTYKLREAAKKCLGGPTAKGGGRGKGQTKLNKS